LHIALSMVGLAIYMRYKEPKKMIIALNGVSVLCYTVAIGYIAFICYITNQNLIARGYITSSLPNKGKYLAIAISFLMLVSFLIMRSAITHDVKQIVEEQIKTFTFTFAVCFTALVLITVLLYVITFSNLFTMNGRLTNI
jgi:hypothetical protein